MYFKKGVPKRILSNEKNSKKIQTIFGFACPNFMIFETTITSQCYRYQNNVW